MQEETVTVFYDGFCPLCVKEMRHLKQLDKRQRLVLIDVNEDDFTDKYPEIDREQALTKLHGYLQTSSEKQLLTGLDVTHQAWRMVGKGWMIAPLRWPVISWFSDRVYLWFAKHRFTISEWLTGTPRCERCKLPLE